MLLAVSRERRAKSQEHPMKPLRIVMASDHAGLDLKRYVADFLKKEGCSVTDVGTHTADSCDYPDFALDGARRLAAGEFDFGVFVCGTGMGVCITANKVKGIRAAPCTLELMAEMARRHNDANIVCLGGRLVGLGLAEAITRRFLETEFEGGRHARRVDKIKALDQ